MHHIITNMRIVSFVLIPAIAAALPLTNRRTAVSNLITSSTAAVISGGASTSSIILPPSIANAADSSVTEVTLNSNNKKAFPLASFGLQVYDDDTAYKLTLTALECGYRNFFASVLAGNQRGFAKAVKDSGIPRKDLYIW